MPAPRTSLIGREEEIATARVLLPDEAAPLLTLAGPGGVGKTRLALALAQDVAASFADGVIFVDLTPVRSPDLVLPAIAQALSIRDDGMRPIAESLATALRPRQALLLLDNCEQVVEVAPLIADLLVTCPALQVVTTSRVPLQLRGEHPLPVSPLSLPPASNASLDVLAASDAVALFVARAHAADLGEPDFATAWAAGRSMPTDRLLDEALAFADGHVAEMTSLELAPVSLKDRHGLRNANAEC